MKKEKEMPKKEMKPKKEEKNFYSSREYIDSINRRNDQLDEIMGKKKKK